MKIIHIELTEEQQKALKPLWRDVIEADLHGKRGAILLMQPESEGRVRCIFVASEQAKKIAEILKELE